MGNQSWVGVGNGGDSTIHNPGSISGGTIYSPIGGPSPVAFTQTTAAQPICRGAMTLKNMVMQFNQITGSGGQVGYLTAGVSIGGSATPGNQSCAISNHAIFSPAAAFAVQDTTHTDAVADGQTYGLIYGGMGSSTCTGIVTPCAAFEQDGVSNNYVTLAEFGTPYTGINNSTKEIGLAGNFHTGSATDAAAALQFPYGLTLDHMQFSITANAAGCTLTTRVNGGAGNQTVTASGTTTGTFEDTTHTDAIAANGLANYKASTGAGGATFTAISIRAVSASPGVSGLYSGFHGGNSNASTAAFFCPFAGQIRFDVAIGETVFNATINGTLSLLNCQIANNTNTASAAFTLMKGNVGAVTGNQTVQFSANQSGTVIDTTHTDALVAGTDMITLSMPGGTGAGTLPLLSQAAMFTAAGSAAHQPDNMTLMGVG